MHGYEGYIPVVINPKFKSAGVPAIANPLHLAVWLIHEDVSNVHVSGGLIAFGFNTISIAFFQVHLS